MRKMTSLYVLITALAFMAVGCGGIPLPEKAESYNTSIERLEQVDLIHVKFDILFDSKGASEDEILNHLNKCSLEGSCGMMARLSDGVEFFKDNFSCTCDLTPQGAVSVDENGDGKMENRQKIAADCIVPIAKEVITDNKVFRLMVTSVSPNSSAGTELAFTSSPEFEVKDAPQIKSLKNFKLNLALN